MSDEKIQKRVLGRGLATLIPGADRTMPLASQPKPIAETAGDGDFVSIPLSKIALNPYQPREHVAADELAELTASVQQHGVLTPILVRPTGAGSFELVAGERRFRAATAAGLSEIPAVVRALDDRSSLAIALIENLQREDLNPIETARAYKRLQDEFGLSQTEVAKEVGKPQPTVANALRLLGLPPSIQDSIASRQISEGHGKAILAVDGDENRVALWKEAVDKKLNVRDTERRASAIKASASHPSKPDIPRGIDDPQFFDHRRALEDDLSMVLGAKTRIKIDKSLRGAIEISFFDQQELDAIIDRLLRRES
jgi:ParB family chromosome partitioning protein